MRKALGQFFEHNKITASSLVVNLADNFNDGLGLVDLDSKLLRGMKIVRLGFTDHCIHFN